MDIKHPHPQPAKTAEAPRSPAFARAKGTCRWCAAPKSAKRSTAEFCSDKCRTDFSNYKKTQGAAIVSQVKRWQKAKRGKDRGRELTILERMARELVRQDDVLGVSHLPKAPPEYHARVVVKAHLSGKKRERQGGVITVGDQA